MTGKNVRLNKNEVEFESDRVAGIVGFGTSQTVGKRQETRAEKIAGNAQQVYIRQAWQSVVQYDYEENHIFRLAFFRKSNGWSKKRLPRTQYWNGAFQLQVLDGTIC